MNDGSDRGAEGEAQGGVATSVAVLLAVAAVIAALIGMRASSLSSAGTDKWHQALRGDIKREAGLVEDVRFVYQEQVPVTLRAAQAKLSAEEIAKAARGTSGDVRALLIVEQTTQKKVSTSLAAAEPLYTDRKYALPGGSYDVIQALVDRRRETPGLLHI